MGPRRPHTAGMYQHCGAACSFAPDCAACLADCLPLTDCFQGGSIKKQGWSQQQPEPLITRARAPATPARDGEASSLSSVGKDEAAGLAAGVGQEQGSTGVSGDRRAGLVVDLSRLTDEQRRVVHDEFQGGSCWPGCWALILPVYLEAFRGCRFPQLSLIKAALRTGPSGLST